MSAIFGLPTEVHLAPFNNFCSPAVEIRSEATKDCSGVSRSSRPEENSGHIHKSVLGTDSEVVHKCVQESDSGVVQKSVLASDSEVTSSFLPSVSSGVTGGSLHSESSSPPDSSPLADSSGDTMSRPLGDSSGVSSSSPLGLVGGGSRSVPGLLSLTHSEYYQLLASGSFSDKYQLLDSAIASGPWTSVYKCADTSNDEKFIAKFCSKQRNGADFTHEVHHEVAVMFRCMKCSYIARLHEIFDSEDDLILVMELIEGGDLQYVLDDDHVPYESDVVRYIIDVLHGLQFLHHLGIAHLDIKPQNVVLTGEFPEAQVKLCDLEVARMVGSEGKDEVRGMLGTPDYVAPEILRMDTITLAADIWSVGVLVYVLLTGFTPFGGDTDAETFRNISLAQVDFPDELFEDISDAAKDWIKSCLVLNPRDRPSVDQLLEHSWLQDQPRANQCTSLAAIGSNGLVSEHGSTLSVVSLTSCANSDATLAGSMLSLASSNASIIDLKLRRTLSKSREAIAERAQRSCLNKYLSKLRKRISDPTIVSGVSGHGAARHQPLTLRTSEPVSSRPRWRTAGAPMYPVPGDRVNSFRVRDHYQNQVAANLAGAGVVGSCQTPFVRRCSLRGTYNDGIGPSTSPPSSTTYSMNAVQKRGNLRDTDTQLYCSEVADFNHENDSIVPINNTSMTKSVVPTSNEKEDVFTRLYNDKISESKRKMIKCDQGNRRNSDAYGKVDDCGKPRSTCETTVPDCGKREKSEHSLKNPRIDRHDIQCMNSSEFLQSSSEFISSDTDLNTKDTCSAINTTGKLNDSINPSNDEPSSNQSSSPRKVDSQTASKTFRKNSSAGSSFNTRVVRKISIDERRSSFHYIKNNNKSVPQKQRSSSIVNNKVGASSVKVKTEDKGTNTDETLLLPLIEETLKTLSVKNNSGNDDIALTSLLKPEVIVSLEKLMSLHKKLMYDRGCHCESTNLTDTDSSNRPNISVEDTVLHPSKNIDHRRVIGQDRLFRLRKSVTDTNLSGVKRGVCADIDTPLRSPCHPPQNTSIIGRRCSLSSDLGSSDTVSDTADSQCSSLDIRELSTVTSIQDHCTPRDGYLVSGITLASDFTGTNTGAFQRRQSCSGSSSLASGLTQPWRALCSGSVSRAVNMFSGLNHEELGAVSHRRKSEPLHRNDLRTHVDVDQS